MESERNIKTNRPLDYRREQIMLATDEKPLGATASQPTFEDLLREHHRKAYSYAYRLCGNREDAEDLTQEAFIRAFRAIDRYDPNRPFERWLFRIISNLFVDTLRSRPRQAPLSLDSPMEGQDGDALFNDIRDDESDPSRLVLREIMDEKLQRAVDSLPPVFRQTVILTDIQGMGYDEASEVLNCAVGTIRSRLHRARVMMRDVLAGKPSRRRVAPSLAPAAAA
jgi:RNA polymerase sigma-70 factor, ECF subfamily